MKRILTTGLIIICFSMLLVAQQGEGLLRDLGSAKLELLESRMSSEVELCISDSPDFFSKAEALQKIKTFLKDVGAKSARKVHSGKSADKGSRYWVGKLKASKGVYRVFLYLEKGEIVEIRFDDWRD